MLNKSKQFLLHSYHADRVAFAFEMVSFVVTVGAAFLLALTAAHPDMRMIYPGFFVGSVTAAYANYRRRLAWPMLLTGYFTLNNIFGFGVSMLWW